VVTLNPEVYQVTGAIPPNVALAVPNDSALPGCELLQLEKLRTELLAQSLKDWLGPKAELLESKAVLLRYVPGKRCNFLFDLMISPTPDAPIERRRVTGKVYAEYHGAKVFRILQEFRSHGLAGGRYRVPQPLAYEPRWKLLLLGWAEGDLLRSRILGDSDASCYMFEVADFLAKFHQSGVAGGSRYTFRRHLELLAGQKLYLTRVLPELEGLLDSILRGIKERGEAISGWAPGPTHRDFSPDHLVLNEGCLTALDFDEFRQYDPMFDVAHFTAHLKLLGVRHGGDVTRFDELGRIFQTAYRGSARDYSEERVRFYQAVAYFKLAYILAAVVRPSAWEKTVEMFLREAAAVLKQDS
jgi:aminoglycoside phosphotransferase (APT) family kinase protein